MKKLRLLLLPFAWIYGSITFLRNKFFDWGIFKSYTIPQNSINVGNLSVGGTGKTPHVDYLITHFLLKESNIATLSRGYGRRSSGLVHANVASTSEDIGDEPCLFKQKHKSSIEVIVSEKRKIGVDYISKELPQTDLIILDDAFQHRAVTAGLNLLITPFNDLFSKDFVLPAGNLREWKLGKKRADIIMVSKSPLELSAKEIESVQKSIDVSVPIHFSSIVYNDLIPISNHSIKSPKNILLVTGIGNPTPLEKHLKSNANVELLKFNDHHEFTTSDLAIISEKFDTFTDSDKIIVTTEKDFMRLGKFQEVLEGNLPWFYQPITIKIHDQQKFNNLIDGYFSKI